MPKPEELDSLADHEVCLALSHLTLELRGTAASDRPVVAADEREARELLASLLASEGFEVAAAGILPEGAGAAEARRALATMADDPVTADLASGLLREPPRDEQMAIEEAAISAVVLGAVIAWLQTRVDIEVSRRDGRTTWSFHLSKSSTDPKTLAEIARILRGLLEK